MKVARLCKVGKKESMAGSRRWSVTLKGDVASTDSSAKNDSGIARLLESRLRSSPAFTASELNGVPS